MRQKYAFQNMNEFTAKAVGRDLGVSTKHAIEICNNIRGKGSEKALKILEDSINMKKPIAFTRFTGGAGHKTAIGSGKFAPKACKEIKKIIDAAKANAQFKGLNIDGLVIRHICAHKAAAPFHYGRQTRRKMKRTHIEVVLEEREKKKTKKETTKEKEELRKEKVLAAKEDKK